MRKYYLFIIKKEYFDIYRKKSYVLYRVLNSLYNLKTYDFSYGIEIYKTICLPFAVSVLKNYINNRIKHRYISNKVIEINSQFEKTYLQINNSCVIIKSNVNIPQILKIFNIYNKNIFVCDFKNNDYFWLQNEIKTTNKR